MIDGFQKATKLEKLEPKHYKWVKLEPHEYYMCSRCGGSGQYLMSGDLHRSEGWVPCNCHGGQIKEKMIEVY